MYGVIHLLLLRCSIGKEYDVQISEISRQGDDIARVQGFVIYVKDGRVGEKARIKIMNVGARFATAQKVTNGAPQREMHREKSMSEPKDQVAPTVTEEENPELQDSKGSGGEEKQP